ncbi:MAG TPA: sugar porter family MFS transporter [Bryobacteraceae bacterium]|nr:sugar porter family MFS transporter [Bryobacteraceae bacterium]
MYVTTPAATTAHETGSALYVYAATLVAAISGLLFGFDIAVINGAIIFLREQLRLTEVQTELAASSLLFGCIFGASVAGWLSDRFGRRRVLMFCAVLFALSSVAAALPRTLAEFSSARFLGGIAIGAASLLAPLYIAEVAPARIRGRLVSLNQMAIVTGILLAYLVNWLLAFAGPAGWRWMFAAAAVPSIALLLGLFFVPESPRWLVENNRAGEALAVLTRVNGATIAGRELHQIQQTIAGESGTLRELLQPGFRRALWIAVSLAILQQATGINTVLFYGSIIFREQVGGHSETSAIFANVVVGLVNFLATFVALGVIDKLGRRPLLMLSTGIMTLCHAGLAAAFLVQPPPSALVLTAMLCAVGAFAIGLGPGFWVVLSEIFPTRIRGRAMSLATICLWGACTLLTMTFLSLARAVSPAGAFLVYSTMCVITFAIVWRVLPETKGRTLEEIERLWPRRK